MKKFLKRALITIAAGFAGLLTLGAILSSQDKEAAEQAGFDSVEEFRLAKKENIETKAEYDAFVQRQAEIDAKAAKDGGFLSVDEYKRASAVDMPTKELYDEYLEQKIAEEKRKAEDAEAERVASEAGLEIAEEKRKAEDAEAERVASEAAARRAAELATIKAKMTSNGYALLSMTDKRFDYTAHDLMTDSCDVVLDGVLGLTATDNAIYNSQSYVHFAYYNGKFQQAIEAVEPKKNHRQVKGFEGFRVSTFLKDKFIVDSDSGVVFGRENEFAHRFYGYERLDEGIVTLKLFNKKDSSKNQEVELAVCIDN